MTDSFFTTMEGLMLEEQVIQTMVRQFGLTMNYDIGTIKGPIPYITTKEYKSIRRGARTILSRAGYNGSEILTDKKLKMILEKAKVEVR